MTKKIFGRHDENTLIQFDDVASRADKAALMADGHLGYIQPVGGVTAYRNKVSIAGVGADIGCGNCAMGGHIDADDFDARDLDKIANEIQSTISFGMGRSNRADDAPTDHEFFRDYRWEAIPESHREELRKKAREQLGTVGGGNHYVDVFKDDSERLCVGVHFGSRGLGHLISQGFMALFQGKKWGEHPTPAEGLLRLDTPLGHDYFKAMQLASDYAFIGRDWVTRKVMKIISPTVMDDKYSGDPRGYVVHNNHNSAWGEMVDGEPMIVVRKGATPAYPGQLGFVGGSMGDNAVILRGAVNVDEETLALQKAAIFSTVHGAGRVMSRTEAAGKIHRKSGRVIKEGKISKEMMDKWMKRQGVILRGGGLDEAPQAYRRLSHVLEAQGKDG